MLNTQKYLGYDVRHYSSEGLKDIWSFERKAECFLYSLDIFILPKNYESTCN